MIERFVKMYQTLNRINRTPLPPPDDPLVAPVMNFESTNVVTAAGGHLGKEPRWGAKFHGERDYSGQAVPGTNAADDGPLVAPTMSFDDTPSQSQGGPTANDGRGHVDNDEDGPLVAPRMEF